MKAVYMCLVHDLGESIIGDITPSDGVTRGSIPQTTIPRVLTHYDTDQKYVREQMAMKFLACTAKSWSPDQANMLLDLWNEYEEGQSKPAQIVKQIDKLECLQQAVMYQQKYQIPLQEFMDLKEMVTLPELKPLLDVCLRKYEEVKMRQHDDLVVVFVSGKTDQSAKCAVLILSGGPGVGKGTQCSRLAREFDFCHISVGDLLRNEGNRPSSPYKDFIPESIQKSVLIPAPFTTELLSEEMNKAQAQGTRRFLLDGFPRSVEQATDFESKVYCSHFSLAAWADAMLPDLQQILHLVVGVFGAGTETPSGTSFYQFGSCRRQPGFYDIKTQDLQ
jgi:5'-deoxynucleotidase YfbR-like HD superfamily hydrolase